MPRAYSTGTVSGWGRTVGKRLLYSIQCCTSLYGAVDSLHLFSSKYGFKLFTVASTITCICLNGYTCMQSESTKQKVLIIYIILATLQKVQAEVEI